MIQPEVSHKLKQAPSLREDGIWVVVCGCGNLYTKPTKDAAWEALVDHVQQTPAFQRVREQIKAQPRNRALAGAMDFLLFMGAARKDANPRQVARIRTEVVPLLAVYRENGNEAPIRAKIQQIMGPDWQPGSDWRLKG